MFQDDLVLLIDAVREGGALALSYFGKDPQTWRKEGGSPVTEADIAVNDLLHARLRDPRPDYGWLSEESVDDPARLAAERVWIIDPIDGTSAFTEGRDDFTVCAGLAERGEMVAAAIVRPATGDLFAALRGGGTTLNGDVLSTPPVQPYETARLVGRRKIMDAKHWRAAPPGGKRGYSGSLAYRLCKVAIGDFDAALALGPVHEWDVAAASLILSEAGGEVTSMRGAALRFNQPMPRHDGMIAAVAPLRRRIAEELAMNAGS